jgi:hypothetical protein
MSLEVLVIAVGALWWSLRDDAVERRRLRRRVKDMRELYKRG